VVFCAQNPVAEAIKASSQDMQVETEIPVHIVTLAFKVSKASLRALGSAESSPSIYTFIGYENAAKIAKHSVKNGLTVREAVDVLSMTHPG
jgi:fumarate hydratase class II